VSVLEEAPAPVEDLDRVRLHAGTAEILARVRPLGAEDLPAGASGFAQFRLERPAVLVTRRPLHLPALLTAHDVGAAASSSMRFPSSTGAATPRRHASWRRPREPSPASARRALVSSAGEGGLLPLELSRRLAQPWPEIARALAPALARDELRALGPVPTSWCRKQAGTPCASARGRRSPPNHRASPISPGLPLEELRARLAAAVPSEGVRAALATLAEEGVLRIEKDVAALPDHRVALEGEEARLAERLSGAFREGGLNPPEAAAALAAVGAESGGNRCWPTWCARAPCGGSGMDASFTVRPSTT
jgi:selenocysteine-specific elongation factor